MTLRNEATPLFVRAIELDAIINLINTAIVGLLKKDVPPIRIAVFIPYHLESILSYHMWADAYDPLQDIELKIRGIKLTVGYDQEHIVICSPKDAHRKDKPFFFISDLGADNMRLTDRNNL